MSEQEISPVSAIPAIDLGLLGYAEALAVQLDYHQRVVDGGEPVFLLVEHPPVLTLGKHADPQNMLFDEATLKASGIEVVLTDRGGEVTAHVPGQLVVYPIIPVSRLGLTPKRYVHLLEDAVIGYLKSYDLVADRDPEHPGVWIGQNKICALGIRIKSRVSMHGLALNVNNDFQLFSKIIPCGIRTRGVTSMQLELGQEVAMSDVRTGIVRRLHAVFDLK